MLCERAATVRANVVKEKGERRTKIRNEEIKTAIVIVGDYWFWKMGFEKL